MVTKDQQWCTFKVLRILTTYNGYNMSKYASNFKIPYYHLLNQWLLGATSANKGQTMMQTLHTPSCMNLIG